MEEGAYSSDDFEDDAQDGVYRGEDGPDEAPEDPDSELITLQEACVRMVGAKEIHGHPSAQIRHPLITKPHEIQYCMRHGRHE
jgi:hypothetical protein